VSSFSLEPPVSVARLRGELDFASFFALPLLTMRGLVIMLSSIRRAFSRRAAGTLVVLLMIFTAVGHGAHVSAASSVGSGILSIVSGQADDDSADDALLVDHCQCHPSVSVLPGGYFVTLGTTLVLRPLAAVAASTPFDRLAESPPPRA
jgi:hypothetical protein